MKSSLTPLAYIGHLGTPDSYLGEAAVRTRVGTANVPGTGRQQIRVRGGMSGSRQGSHRASRLIPLAGAVQEVGCYRIPQKRDDAANFRRIDPFREEEVPFREAEGPGRIEVSGPMAG